MRKKQAISEWMIRQLEREERYLIQAEQEFSDKKSEMDETEQRATRLRRAIAALEGRANYE